MACVRTLVVTTGYSHQLFSVCDCKLSPCVHSPVTLRVSMEMMVHQVHQVSQDAMELR